MSGVNFPEDGSPLSAEDVMEPLYAAITFAYKMERKNIDKNIPWHGPDIQLQGCLPPKKALSASNLKYSLEEQGRDALEEILYVAIQMGIEQGERVFKKSDEYKLSLMNEFFRGASIPPIPTE